MKKIFTSFYSKLAVIFLALLIILGAAFFFITTHAWHDYQLQTDQQLNSHLARDMAADFAPALKEKLDLDAVKHMIHYMMVINPKVEIYILDGAGKILAFFATPDKKVKVRVVDTAPIKSFIDGTKPFPILGADPRHPDVQKPFSAARLKIGKNINGFLYVIIGSELYTSAAQSGRGNFVTRTFTRGLLLTLLLAAISGLIIFRLLTRRLRKMQGVVNRFENGDTSVRVDVSSRDELADLGLSFNHMADTINRQINELKKTDQLRRELIANVSHDLRSPLASIRGYLETIQIKGASLRPEELNKYIEILLDSTLSLERLVNQLFELSKLDARQIEPMCEPFLLKDFIYDVAMKFHPRAEAAGIRLTIDIRDGLPQVYADVALIERVISNLIDNAIRYTPKGGYVKIVGEPDGDVIRVRVEDSGPGIPAEDIPLIFNRFYRVEKSRSGQTGGTGLGLAIANKIMQLHKSAIEVKSEIKKGSAFSFKLQTWHPSNA